MSCELEFRAAGLLLDQLLAGNADSIVSSQVKAFVARARTQQQQQQQQQQQHKERERLTRDAAAAAAAAAATKATAANVAAPNSDTAHWERQQREAATRGWQPS